MYPHGNVFHAVNKNNKNNKNTDLQLVKIINIENYETYMNLFIYTNKKIII